MEKGYVYIVLHMNTNKTASTVSFFFFCYPKMIYIKVFNLINVHNIASVFLTYISFCSVQTKYIKTHQFICSMNEKCSSHLTSQDDETEVINSVHFWIWIREWMWMAFMEIQIDSLEYETMIFFLNDNLSNRAIFYECLFIQITHQDNSNLSANALKSK